ncbi:MAG TPA: ester cyclase [Candidatus Angelobacter sp.]
MRKLSVVFVLTLLCSYLAVANPRATTCQDRDNEQNERIASLVITDVIGKAQFEEGQHFFAQDSTIHFGDKDLTLRAAIEEAQSWRRVAPDFEIKVVSIESRCDRVTVHWTASGTNTGTGEGLPKPTGKHIRTHGSGEFLFANGRIAESWLHWNEEEVVRQLLGGDPDDKDSKDHK